MSDRYTVEIFYSLDDEGFIAVVPDLPGCSAFEMSREGAASEIGHAIEAYLDARRRAAASGASS